MGICKCTNIQSPAAESGVPEANNHSESPDPQPETAVSSRASCRDPSSHEAKAAGKVKKEYEEQLVEAEKRSKQAQEASLGETGLGLRV